MRPSARGFPRRGCRSHIPLLRSRGSGRRVRRFSKADCVADVVALCRSTGRSCIEVPRGGVDHLIDASLFRTFFLFVCVFLFLFGVVVVVGLFWVVVVFVVVVFCWCCF